MPHWPRIEPNHMIVFLLVILLLQYCLPDLCGGKKPAGIGEYEETYKWLIQHCPLFFVVRNNFHLDISYISEFLLCG